MEIKELTQALLGWAEDSEKRNVLVIATEKCNETEDGYTLATSSAINGKSGHLADSIVAVMEDNKNFANIVKSAFIKYTMKHSEGVGIGIVSVAGKEGEDE